MLWQTVITWSSLPKAYSQGVALRQELSEQARKDWQIRLQGNIYFL